MLEWWESAYLNVGGGMLKGRFVSEATLALPLRAMAGEAIPETIFEAVLFKRAGLKQDLQLPDWEYAAPR